MNVNQTLRELIEADGREKTEIARKLGITKPQAFNTRLKVESTPKVDFVAALLNELGYKLVAVKATVEKLPKGSIVLDPEFEYRSMPEKARGAQMRVMNQRAAQNSSDEK